MSKTEITQLEWHDLYHNPNDLPKKNSFVLGFIYGKDNWRQYYFREDGKWFYNGLVPAPTYWAYMTYPSFRQDKD